MNQIPQTAPQAAAPVFRQCFSCHLETVTDQTTCPRCGKGVFFTQKNIRIRGGILIALGTFLAALIVGVSIFVAVLLMGAAKDPTSAQKISADRFTFVAVYCLFAVLISLGLYFILLGGWMLIFGKRDRVMIWIMWGLLTVVLLAAGIVGALV